MNTSGQDFACVEQAFRVIDKLEHLESSRAIMRKLASALSPFGFRGFLITRLPQPKERLAPYSLIECWPAGWMAHYERHDYYRHDPVARHCFSTIEPFLWSEAHCDDEREPHARRVMSEAAEFGMKEGVCVPLHDVNGFQAVVSMTGERLEFPPQGRRVVHLLALYAYAAADRVTQPARPADYQALSPREREVLCWIAVGKTAWEVGEILSVSSETVRTHLQRARLKLGTTNNTHSVVEALRRHEIKL